MIGVGGKGKRLFAVVSASVFSMRLVCGVLLRCPLIRPRLVSAEYLRELQAAGGRALATLTASNAKEWGRPAAQGLVEPDEYDTTCFYPAPRTTSLSTDEGVKTNHSPSPVSKENRHLEASE